jgi:hypothetical protein
METQYTISHFLDSLATTNLVLKEQISKIQLDILSFDEFMMSHKQLKKEPSFLKGFDNEASILE